MRTFVVVCHAVPPTGDWTLDDLPSAGGRVDVAARAVTAALCTSHGIRADTQVIVVVTFDPAAPKAVRFRGDAIRHLNPDERSTAARIQQALRAGHDDPWWDEVQPGLDVAPYALGDVLDEAPGALWVLDAGGDDIGEAALPAASDDATFVLSDHQAFTADESATLAAGDPCRLSLGDAWLHGHHCIHIVQWWLDRAI